MINVDYGEEAVDDDELFNTSYVVSSLAVSKSLNDIYNQSIPQNGLQPRSLAFQSDLFFCVSICRRSHLELMFVAARSLHG